MKPFLLICSVGLIFLCGCKQSSDSAYQKLKAETGATDEELEKSIKFHTEVYIALRDEIDAGSLKPQDFVEAMEWQKEAMATMLRDDEMTAVMMFAVLRELETKGSDEAARVMVKRLKSYLETPEPITESSGKIRAKILEYSATSEAFKAYEQATNKALDASKPVRPE